MQNVQQEGRLVTVTTWLRGHRPALVLTAFYTLAGIVVYLIPFWANVYPAQTYLRMGAYTVLGLVLFPPMLVIDPAQITTETPFQSVPGMSSVVMVCLVALGGLIVALLLERQWRRSGFSGKAWVVAFFLISILVGLLLAVGKYGYFPELASDCTYPVRGNAEIRITTYRHRDNTGYWFFRFRETDGAAGAQFMDFSYDRPVSDCSTIGVFDEQFFWVWTKNLLAITHDGGRTWDHWSPHEAELPRYLVADYARIEGVEFDDQASGVMYLRPTRWWTQDHVVLHSDDGGASWTVIE